MFIFRSPSPHGYDGIMSDSESQSLGFKFNFQFRRVKPELAANKLNSSSIPLSSRESCAAAAHELVPRPLTNLNKVQTVTVTLNGVTVSRLSVCVQVQAVPNPSPSER